MILGRTNCSANLGSSLRGSNILVPLGSIRYQVTMLAFNLKKADERFCPVKVFSWYSHGLNFDVEISMLRRAFKVLILDVLYFAIQKLFEVIRKKSRP